MTFFDINRILFSVWGYNVSYLEFTGMVSGLAAVMLSARANIWSWPIGIVNVVLSAFLFYQVQLYPDMFLQMFFFVTNILGWWRWLHPKPGEEDRRNQLRVSWLGKKELVVLIIAGLWGTFVMGKFSQNLHHLLPAFFNRPGAFPYHDSFIMVMSIVTTFYMIAKKIECWIIWIIVDIVAAYLYFQRDLVLYSLLYAVFCFIATYGLIHWIREYRSYSPRAT